jgi:hypothetical protein
MLITHKSACMYSTLFLVGCVFALVKALEYLPADFHDRAFCGLGIDVIIIACGPWLLWKVIKLIFLSPTGP